MLVKKEEKKKKMRQQFSSSSFTIVCVGLVVMFAAFIGSCGAHELSTDFYKTTCPLVFPAVKSVVMSAVAKEKRMGASLLRLHFHDCFVQGCDGSILLDDTSSFNGSEKPAAPNINSVRGFEVIDEIKSAVEAVCPGVVSCADIVAIAARDSVLLLGGPYWKVKVGRRDSKSANLSAANTGALPSPLSNLSNLVTRFSELGLSTKDMIVLSGAHTIGKARCASFEERIHKESNIDPTFASKMQEICPLRDNNNNNLAPLDYESPNLFDNSYFKLLLQNKGLLHSDQVLYDGGPTDSLVETYSQNDHAFHSDFVTAMIKMAGIFPLTGSEGEIRINCRKPN